ncbi:MAG: ferrochelatase [Acidobacteria bacterium]|nr:MAG: ferrochelatase [Acidobacteriota bacterium]
MRRGRRPGKLAGMPRAHVLLVNLGTPEAPTEAAVRAFLDEFLSDPSVVDLPRWIWLPLLRLIVLRRRPERVARQYASIWSAEGSPLEVGTRRIARALAARLGARAAVEPAYRYGRRRVDERLEAALARGRSAVVLPLFPQPARATTGTIAELAEETALRIGARDRLRFAVPACDASGYVEALADRCREAFRASGGSPDRLVVSFHGLPVRQDRREGGRYSEACRRTFAALLRALDWPEERAHIAYQSRFGPGRWLSPATEAVLRDLGRQGAGHVAVVCPGFLTDGLETIEEIGVRGARIHAAAGGGRLTLVPAVADHPRFVEELAHLAEAALDSLASPAVPP